MWQHTNFSCVHWLLCINSNQCQDLTYIHVPPQHSANESNLFSPARIAQEKSLYRSDRVRTGELGERQRRCRREKRSRTKGERTTGTRWNAEFLGCDMRGRYKRKIRRRRRGESVQVLTKKGNFRDRYSHSMWAGITHYWLYGLDSKVVSPQCALSGKAQRVLCALSSPSLKLWSNQQLLCTSISKALHHWGVS